MEGQTLHIFRRRRSIPFGRDDILKELWPFGHAQHPRGVNLLHLA